MIDREKVIKGLECCMVGDGHSPKCEICPYATVGDDTCQTMDALFSDALALLKAQEPRVMTLEEALNAECVYLDVRIHSKVVCCILALDDDNYIRVLKRGFGGSLEATAYGTEWRCWTSRPTDAQREGTPWN